MGGTKRLASVRSTSTGLRAGSAATATPRLLHSAALAPDTGFAFSICQHRCKAERSGHLFGSGNFVTHVTKEDVQRHTAQQLPSHRTWAAVASEAGSAAANYFWCAAVMEGPAVEELSA